MTLNDNGTYIYLIKNNIHLKDKDLYANQGTCYHVNENLHFYFGCETNGLQIDAYKYNMFMKAD